MIVALCNTKGGTGKSTVAVNLAISFAQAGRRVLLLDGDRQGSAAYALKARAQENLRPAVAVDACFDGDGNQLLRMVGAARRKYQDMVIDAGGRDSSALRAALVAADVVLVPFLPRSFDVWALKDVAGLIGEANSARQGRQLRAFAFLNCADVAGADNADAAACVADAPPLVLLDAPLSRRKAFPNAAGFGRNVHELRPPDVKACAELAALVAALNALRW